MGIILILILYSSLSGALLIAAFSKQMTGRINNAFMKSAGRIISIGLASLTITIAGIPLFLAGTACSFYWIRNEFHGWGYLIWGVGITISLFMIWLGFLVCRTSWRWMKKQIPPHKIE
jgi:NADH:ubiquinone oxidoreductase subunit 5 (subunit L)/multisubunit Na+/H+ antiporter MnhA subunit